MFSLLIAVIYISFISLGLPDSLLGSAWPVMQVELGLPLSFAGVITMIIAAGTIISALFSYKLINKLGAGLVTAISVGTTALALFGFSVANSALALCLLAIPYGLGAGAVDAALNNYVAIHYSSRHMSWLHAFWGVGVTISPYIMSFCLSEKLGWNMGYRSVSIIQIVLTAFIFMSLPLWKKGQEEEQDEAGSVSLKSALKIKGVVFCLVAFLAYCALETTAGLWATSYLVEARGAEPEIAASFAALFYIGITVGRFLNGLIADKFGDKTMIRVGSGIMILGVLMVLLPLKTDYLALSGLVVLGLGAAPVYPSIIHATPNNFGRENSQALVGIQMASAYTGTTLMPPLFGLIAQYISISLYPVYLGFFAVLLIVMSEIMNRKVKDNLK